MRFNFMSFPVVIGLSLANTCPAQCIWCPIGRRIHTPRKNRFMPMGLVEKVIIDLQGRPVRELWFSENGEGLCHPKFKKIISLFRHAFPTVPFGITSNFLLMNEDMARFILSMGFFWVGFNIDGASKETYEEVKKIPYEAVMENLTRMVGLRNQIKDSITAFHGSVLPAAKYYLSIGEPEKIKSPDETYEVFKMLRNLLTWGSKDTILNPFILTWAERAKWRRPKKPEFCAGIYSIGHKGFIDTDANMYPCCSDYNSEYPYGNLFEDSIAGVWSGERRQRFLDLLLKAKYSTIGEPCVNCQD